MAGWTLDEGLERLDQEWRAQHPGAVIYHIADGNHSQNPRVSQHAKDDGKSGGPGDTPGEVDASDFMPGKGGVTDEDLDELAEGLVRSRDPRILIVIRRQSIWSSYPVGNYPAWAKRPYSGKYHGHTHLSVNDKYASNKSDWKWEPVANEIPMVKLDGVWVPQLKLGHDDAMDEGYNHVKRAQVLANWLDNKRVDLDVDGVYGAGTAAKFAAIFGGNGKALTTEQWRKLHGI